MNTPQIIHWTQKFSTRLLVKSLLLAYIITLIMYSHVLAQDYAQFSQFYNNLTYLNPAFVGSSSEQFLLAANHRRQWNGQTIGTGYVTTAFSLEYAATNNGFSYGLNFVDDLSGDSKFIQQHFSPSVSYVIRLGQVSALSLGTAMDYHLTRLDGRYIEIDDLNTGAPSATQTRESTGGSFNLSTGLLYTRPRWWLGISWRDMINDAPPSSLYSTNRNSMLGLWSMHTTYLLPLSNAIHTTQVTGTPKEVSNYEWTLFGFANYRQQGVTNQFETGLLIQHNVFAPNARISKLTVNAGLSYRSFAPSDLGLDKRDALISTIGIKGGAAKKRALYNLTLSHDFTISGLTRPEVGPTGGAWELSLILSWTTPKFRVATMGYDPTGNNSTISGKSSPRKWLYSARPTQACPIVKSKGKKGGSLLTPVNGRKKKRLDRKQRKWNWERIKNAFSGK